MFCLILIEMSHRILLYLCYARPYRISFLLPSLLVAPFRVIFLANGKKLCYLY